MKQLIVLVVLMSGLHTAQVFEKITSGAAVTDGGDSRAVNWIDYDNDGDLDLFVTNGPQSGQNNFFYENLGGGVFQKQSELAITKDGMPSDGSTWGDFNNDGFPDLYVANWWNRKGLFYKNNGNKTFTQITNSGLGQDNSYSETASWADYNRDGLLDLYVCNSEGTKKNFLYKNNGDGTFAKITIGPQSADAFYSRNVDWIDYNNDGWPDIFVTNENDQNENLYKNNGDGTFSNISLPSLLESAGNSTSSNWEDVDNDGDLDVFIANYNNQRNILLLNDGHNNFTKSPSFDSDPANSFCSSFGDIDNDGDLDLFVTNAFTGNNKTVNFLYINQGEGKFIRDTAEIVSKETGWGYGSAFGDYDNDGHLDLFVAKCFGAVENNSLYHNICKTGNWAEFDLTGIKSNRSAIGAIVRVKSKINGRDIWQQRHVAGQNGYCGQTLRLHFGLGDASIIDTLQVIWPSGTQQSLSNLEVNKIRTIIEDTGRVTGVRTGVIEKPEKIFLNQNYPNPFNPSTTINYKVPTDGRVILDIVNLEGSLITKLVDEERSAGEYSNIWNAENIPSGVYFSRLLIGGALFTRKMLLLR